MNDSTATSTALRDGPEPQAASTDGAEPTDAVGSNALIRIQPAPTAVIVATPSNQLLDTVLEYGRPLLAAIEAASNAGEPDVQVERWREALAIGRELRGALAVQELDQEKYEHLLGLVGSEQARWLEASVMYAVHAESALGGLLANSEALAAITRGHHGIAASLYETVSELMKSHVGEPWLPEAEYLRTLARAMSPMQRGYDRARLGALAEATQAFQLSQARVANEVIPLLDRMEEAGADFGEMRLQLQAFELGAVMTMLLDELRNERFEPARTQADALTAIAKVLGQTMARSQMPAEQRIQGAATYRAIASVGKAWREFAMAELDRQNQRWTDAEAGYSTATTTLKEAGQAMAGLEDVPIARDVQTVLLNTSMIDAARRRLAENRALVEEGERRTEGVLREAAAWKEAMTALQRFSPTVNLQTFNEVNVSLSLMVEVSQVAQQQFAADLGQLGRAIEGAELPADERARLLAEIDALKASAKTAKPESFFKKAGEFAETASKILKGVKEVAEPLGKVVSWVAPLAAALLAR